MADSTPNAPDVNDGSPTNGFNAQPPGRSHTIDVIEHRIGTGFRSIENSYKRRKTRSTNLILQDWNVPDRPYLDYLRELVAAGWSNLEDLDKYLTKTIDAPVSGLVISVLDILDGSKTKRWPDIHSEPDLKTFMEAKNRGDSRVRLYMAEYEDEPAPGLIETLGGCLKLDPRFFQWSIHSKGHVFTPSQRHHAPYVSLGFGVLNGTTAVRTDAKRFKVLVYIQPDEDAKGWTGVLLFSTHFKISLNPRIITNPPPFRSQLPPPSPKRGRTFRELYLESFEYTNLEDAVRSPFYAISHLLRLDCFCWNQIITAIREEDRRINGISDTTIGHAEEIKKTLGVVQRGGTYAWLGRDEKITKESQAALEEDFQHLVEQTDLLWQTRDKLTAIRQQRSETRWSSLTNAFTYLFAPVTIISGVYGMNVSQLTGSNSNPGIWQFFVAVAGLNLVVVVALAVSNWIHIQFKHSRAAGLKEVLAFAFGRTSASAVNE